MVVISGDGSAFNSATSPVHISSPTAYIYKWLVRVRYGEKLKLTWTFTASQVAAVKVQHKRSLAKAEYIAITRPVTQQSL